MKDKLIRIALIGPESTGKSDLSRDLAAYFQTAWVPEFGRGYLTSLQRPYEKEDLFEIAKGHLLSEEIISADAKKFLFIDTEMIMMKIWLQVVYGETSEWLEEKIGQNKYDLYLLTYPDIPFVPDPLRENPHRRDYLYNLHRDELDNRGLRYEVITGTKDRLKNAIEAVQRHYLQR